MRTIPVELDDETAEALETERRLVGFESRSAYVEWIVANRAAIDPESGHEPLLESARERIAELEARLDDAAEDDRAADDAAPTPSTDPAGDGDRADADGGWTRPRSDPTVRVRGSPRTTVWREGDDADGDRDASTADAASSSADADGASMHLTPERVERVPEDPVAEDADVLGSVEVDRLDELSRRAVAKTRRRLNRDVETGLAYASSTRLSSDVRPGEDVVDLESLSVPGRSAEVVDRRREAAGRAIAYLRDVGRARRSDFVEALYEECPGGYDTADGWWRCVKDALKQVDAVDGGSGARVWRFEG